MRHEGWEPTIGLPFFFCDDGMMPARSKSCAARSEDPFTAKGSISMMILGHDAMPLALELGCVVSLCHRDGTEAARGRASRTQDDKNPDLRVSLTDRDEEVEYVALSADGAAFLALVAEEG